jgi:hypothetical protein
MKKNLGFAAALILFLGSCGSADYPDITYTNNSGVDIEFYTVEADSPEYKLAAGKSLQMSSNVRGRAEILRIVDKPLVGWRYGNGGDVYNIEFVHRREIVRIDLEVRNYSGRQVDVTEKYGLLEWDNDDDDDDDTDKTKGSNILLAGGSAARAWLYTETPFWVLLTDGSVPGFQTKRLSDPDTYFLAIEPPDGEWWKQDFPTE